MNLNTTDLNVIKPNVNFTALHVKGGTELQKLQIEQKFVKNDKLWALSQDKDVFVNIGKAKKNFYDKVIYDLYSKLCITQDSKVVVKEKGGLFSKTLGKKDVQAMETIDKTSGDRSLTEQAFGSVDEDDEKRMDKKIADKTVASIIHASESFADEYSK